MVKKNKSSRTNLGFATWQEVGSQVNINAGIYVHWSNAPKIQCSDAGIQSLIDASLNTIYNNAQETIADGMGRERQQYSGDIGHELHALYSVFGEYQLPARYINTFSQGITLDGFFLGHLARI